MSKRTEKRKTVSVHEFFESVPKSDSSPGLPFSLSLFLSLFLLPLQLNQIMYVRLDAAERTAKVKTKEKQNQRCLHKV